MRRLLAGLLAASFAPALARATATDVGTAGVPFLTMQQGARPVGMGGAFTAVADDANALWWNPAGVARSKQGELTVSHTAFIEDTKTEYFAVSHPVPALRGALGMSATYLTVPGVDGLDANGNSTGKLTSNAYAVSLAYAAALVPDSLWLGAAAKVIGEKLATETGQGAALDLGAQFKQDQWLAGVVLQNSGPAFRIGNDSSPLPLTLRGGVGYEFGRRVIAAVDVEKARGGDVLPHVGAEVKLTPNFQIRAGWQKIDYAGSGAGLSFGFSLLGFLGGSSGWAGETTPWWERGEGEGGMRASLDYSFLSFGELSDVHRISLSLRF